MIRFTRICEIILLGVTPFVCYSFNKNRYTSLIIVAFSEFLLPPTSYLGGEKTSMKLRDIIDSLKVQCMIFPCFLFHVEMKLGFDFYTYAKRSTLFARFQSIYCTRTGVEYMHLTNYEQQDWIRKRWVFLLW